MPKSSSEIKREAAKLFKNVAVQDNTRDREFSGVKPKHIKTSYKEWRKGNRDQLLKEWGALGQWPPTNESKGLGKQFLTRFMGSTMPLREIGARIANTAAIDPAKIVDVVDDAANNVVKLPRDVGELAHVSSKAIGNIQKALTRAPASLPSVVRASKAAPVRSPLQIALAPQRATEQHEFVAGEDNAPTVPPLPDAFDRYLRVDADGRGYTADDVDILELQGLSWDDGISKWLEWFPEENHYEIVNTEPFLTAEMRERYMPQVLWLQDAVENGIDFDFRGGYDDHYSEPPQPPISDYFASSDGFAGFQPGVNKVISKLPNSFDLKTLQNSLKGLKKAEINALDLDSIGSIVRDGKIRKADFANFAEEKIGGAIKNTTFNNDNTSYGDHSTTRENYVEHTFSLGDRFNPPKELTGSHKFEFGYDTKAQDNLYGWLRATQDGDAYRIEEIQSDVAQGSPKELVRKARSKFNSSVDKYANRVDQFSKGPYRTSEEIADMALNNPVWNVVVARNHLESMQDYLNSTKGKELMSYLDKAPVQDFTEAALNRAILDAVKSGKNKIQLVDGQTHGNRWGDDPQRTAGLIDYYDVKVPNLLNKLLKKHGAFEVGEVPDIVPDAFGGRQRNRMFKEWMLSPEAIESIKKRGVDMFSLATTNNQGLA